MPAKRNPQQEGLPQAKRPRQAPIYLGDELEEFLAPWWEENRCLYDKSHPNFSKPQIKAEVYRKKLNELKSSEEWGQLEKVQELTIDSFKRVRMIFYVLQHNI